MWEVDQVAIVVAEEAIGQEKVFEIFRQPHDEQGADQSSRVEKKKTTMKFEGVTGRRGDTMYGGSWP